MFHVLFLLHRKAFVKITLFVTCWNKKFKLVFDLSQWKNAYYKTWKQVECKVTEKKINGAHDEIFRVFSVVKYWLWRCQKHRHVLKDSFNHETDYWYGIISTCVIYLTEKLLISSKFCTHSPCFFLFEKKLRNSMYHLHHPVSYHK